MKMSCMTLIAVPLLLKKPKNFGIHIIILVNLCVFSEIYLNFSKFMRFSKKMQELCKI